ncbi:hypothetical protein MLD38_040375 [Melastoma candidum]|uniref:Uncharacterized protein n=1 Tax=Melastoma candidum TaxID=119954 RepID=A0ACB9L747_9MYRT|nr:hypothetical protein MLD38_040375 [Melastoma candidum]
MNEVTCLRKTVYSHAAVDMGLLAITGIESVGKGLIRDGTGFMTFRVKYQCILFRPFKEEIWEAVVTTVNKV